MRKYLFALALFAAPAMAASDIIMHRDPGCGCCEAWAAQVAKEFGQAVKMGASKNPSASRADLIHWFRGRIGCVRWNYSGFRLS
jgi:hypothetical protein